MSASTLELTDKNFEETLAKGGTLIIDFWASWCGPCVRFAPIFEAAAETHKDIIFAKVNTEEQQALANAFDIQAIPTLAVFRDGILIGQNQGALPAHALEQVVQQVQSLDMNKVKAEIAAKTAQAPVPAPVEVAAAPVAAPVEAPAAAVAAPVQASAEVPLPVLPPEPVAPAPSAPRPRASAPRASAPRPRASAPRASAPRAPRATGPRPEARASAPEPRASAEKAPKPSAPKKSVAAKAAVKAASAKAKAAKKEKKSAAKAKKTAKKKNRK